MKTNNNNMPPSSGDILKILVISFSFYPDDSPNTYRWMNIIDVWAKRGIKVFVISAQKEGFSEYESRHGIEIYRTGSSLFQRIKTKIGKRSSNNVKLNANQKIVSEGILRKVYNYTWKNLQWPDWAFLFYAPALKMARRIIKKEAINKIITVSWPFTDHLIGYRLKNEYKLNWLAETIDPFSFNEEINNSLLYSSLNRVTEKKVLGAADQITVMTDGIKKKYISLYPELKNKISVVHNIYVPLSPQGGKIIPKRNGNTVKLVFVGTLSASVRSPEILLRVFKLLQSRNSNIKYELHFYGKIHSNIKTFNSYQSLLNKFIFIHGMIHKNLVSDILMDADILVNIGNSNPFQEPSKIIEYVYMGKPIINICSIVNDSSRDILDKYPLSANIFKHDSDDDIINKINELFRGDNSAQQSIINEILAPYMLVQIECKYSNIIL